MKSNTLKLIALTFCSALLFTSCSDDDNSPVDQIAFATCDDGVMNRDETSVDCGGSCDACEEPSAATDFSGRYQQADHLGRPGINTVLSVDVDGQASVKDAHNVTIPSEMQANFQAGFEARLEQYHDVFAVLLGLHTEDVNFEPNILGDILNGPDKDGSTDNPVSATVLTSVLADDVLEVAPDVATTYFHGGAGAPTFEGAVGFTGRTPQDDVIDVSLILLFGGANGDRFSGQDTDNDGTADLPRLTSDGVSLTADIGTTFPYLGSPE